MSSFNVVGLIKKRMVKKTIIALKAMEPFSWYFHFMNMLMSSRSDCVQSMRFPVATGCVASLFRIATSLKMRMLMIKKELTINVIFKKGLVLVTITPYSFQARVLYFSDLILVRTMIKLCSTA